MEQFQFEIGISFVLLLLGFFFGRYAEKKHFESIIKREAQLANVVVIASKNTTASDSEKPGMIGSMARVKDLYGKVTEAHSENRVRADKLVD